MLEGMHYQNAYVTRNIEKAIEAFKARADIRKLIQYEGTTQVMTPAGPATQSSKLAFIWVDDLQYELIEPIGGTVTLYRDALPADDAPVFHHICMRVDDWKSFRARVDQQSLPVVLEGGNDALRFLYLDARSFLGHYLEYTCMNSERWAQLGGR
jgi:hypothetical protein